MQNYYNSVSERKRIAFVDNLTDEDARILSEKYPNVVCFASQTTTTKPYPVIWFNNKRYGFTSIDEKTIQIADNLLIGLQITDDDGKLQLYVSPVIDNWILTGISPMYKDGNRYKPINVNLINTGTTAIPLSTLYNKFQFAFKFTQNDQEVTTNKQLYNIQFADSDYYTLDGKDSNGNYILSITNYDTTGTNSTISTSMNINYDIQTKNFNNYILKRIPDNCNWYDGSNIIQQLSGITIANISSHNIYFNWSDTGRIEYNKGYNVIVKAIANGNDTVIKEFEDINDGSSTGTYNFANINLSNDILTYITNSSIQDFVLSVYITQKISGTNYTKQVGSLPVQIGDSQKLFYIGTNWESSVVQNGDNYILNETGIINITSYFTGQRGQEINSNENNWYYISNIDFNDYANTTNNRVQITNRQTKIIIPKEYKLGFPLYTDVPNNISISDPMWTCDDRQIININGNEYNIYSINNEYFESGNSYLLSVLYKKLN